MQSGQKLAILGGEPVRAKPIDAIVSISDRARERVIEVLDSGKLSEYYNGPWARRLEEAFAQYHGANLRAVAVNSGTSALHLSVTAAGIGPGDEVIMPALCFVAAATAVVQNGGVPVICDAEPGHLTPDVDHVECLIGPRTKAILTVHFWGYPSDVSRLRSLCARRGLSLIEDCAQALGAPACGGRVGDACDFSTYAFSVRKHVACGEGGIVMCGTEDSWHLVRSLSNYGKGPGWDGYLSAGYSYRLPEISAVIALDGLERLDEEIRARQQAGRYYSELFRDTGLSVIPEPPWGGSVFFKCPVLLPVEMVGLRQRIVDAIQAENVSCRIPHRPLFTIPWLRQYLEGRKIPTNAADYPVVLGAHDRLIELESGPHLPIDEAYRSGEAVMKVLRHLHSL